MNNILITTSASISTPEDGTMCYNDGYVWIFMKNKWYRCDLYNLKKDRLEKLKKINLL